MSKKLKLAEVLLEIVEGQVWKGTYEDIVGLSHDRVEFKWNLGIPNIVNLGEIYELEENTINLKVITFLEAIAEFSTNNKTIKSLETGNSFNKSDLDYCEFYSLFSRKEVNGKWVSF